MEGFWDGSWTVWAQCNLQMEVKINYKIKIVLIQPNGSLERESKRTFGDIILRKCGF